MAKFKLGDRVKKVSGSQWHGVVVGTYSTELTPEGYAVESATEKGSVQIYPAKALEMCEGKAWQGITQQDLENLTHRPLSPWIRKLIEDVEALLKERNE